MRYFLLPILVGMSVITALAQPANNNFGSATVLTMNTCSANAAYTTVAATSDLGPGSCWNTTGGSNVWFTFVATTTQANIQLFTGGAEGTLQYGYVAVWQSDGSTPVACNTYASQYDDVAIGSVSLSIGDTYYISVDNHNGSAGYRGTFKLCINDVVNYDFYEGATSVGTTSCSANAAYTTVGASKDKNAGSCWNTIGGSNRWFKFVATTTQIKVDVKTGGVEGTLQYPYVALWASNGTTQLACLTYSSQYSDLSLNQVGLTIGATYYVSVDNHNGSSGYRGSFTFCVSDAVDYDFYEGAITVATTSCSANAAYTTDLATSDKNAGSCWNTIGGSNRWFKFVATTTQIKVDVKTGGAEGTLQYPYVALWAANGTTQLACLTYSSQYSDLSLNQVGLTIGATYYVSVDNHNGSSSYRGSFTFCVSDAVDYDFYEGAITVATTSCSANAAYTTDLATSDKNAGSCWNTIGGSNRWFKFVATTTQIKVDVKTGGAEGTLQYPYVALWAANGTTQLACLTYSSQYSDLSLNQVGLTIGATYYVSVDNHNGSTNYRGSFTFCVSDAVDYDFYEGAITVATTSCSANAAYTTDLATSDKNAGSCWNTIGGSNRWFTFVATTTQIKVDVKTGGAEGTLQYPYVALWAANGTTQLACLTYSSQYSDLSLNQVGLTIGATYYVSVDNHNGSTGYRGSFTFCMSDAVDYDYYEGAILLSDINNWCSANAIYTTDLATSDKIAGSCWNTVGGSNRWFKFVATTNFINIEVKTGGASGNLQYPYVALWAANGTTQLACQQYFSQYSDLNLTQVGLTIGATYYISVDNNNGSTGYRGTFTLCAHDQPSYDFYEGAIELTDLNNWCSADATYTTLNATKDKNQGSCWNTTGGSNRWFKFTAITNNATIQLRTGAPEGTLQYPYLALWQADGTTQIACATYSAQYSDLSFSVASLVVGNVYYISVDNHNGSANYRGTFKLCVNNIATNYYSRATGLWNDVNSWSTVGYGGAAAASFPNAGDVANIQDNAITVSAAQQAAEVNLNVSTANTDLIVNSASLNVAGKVTLTNTGNNFSGAITVTGNGTMFINDNLQLSRSGGNSAFGATVNTGSSLTINKDLNWTSTGGTVTDNILTVNGTGQLSVNRDINLTSTGGRLIQLVGNNTSTITVARDITFTATAAGQEQIQLNNAARLRIGRNFVRGGTPFGSLVCNNTSTVELFTNTYLQTLAASAGSGGDAFNYNNLTINNTRITSPQVTLAGAVNVNGNLTLTSGIFSTTATNILNLKNATVTTIGSASSYIDGPMTYEVAAAGASVRNLPIGNSGSYRPAILTVNHTDATSVIYTAQHFTQSAAALGYTLPGTIERVSGVRYWRVNRSAVANLTNANIRLYYGIGTGDGVTDPANLRVVKTNGAGTVWFDVGGTGSAAGSGTITSNNFTSFSDITLGNAVGGTNPLPIELKSFEAFYDGADVLLEWSTASELNNDFFTVQRSVDGEEFSELFRVSGAGTSAESKSYRAIDDNPIIGVSYYRLKQTDFDGKSTFSKVLKIETSSGSGLSFDLYPNPTDGLNTFSKINGVKASDLVQVSLRDLMGRVLFSTLSSSELNNERIISLEIETLPKGIYIVTIGSGSQSISKRLVIK